MKKIIKTNKHLTVGNNKCRTLNQYTKDNHLNNTVLIDNLLLINFIELLLLQNNAHNNFSSFQSYSKILYDFYSSMYITKIFYAKRFWAISISNKKI